MYIAIAGNIGSGKTTLTEMLTERYGAKAYYEQSDNPYIGDFYNDMNRWSFNLQMYFWAAAFSRRWIFCAAVRSIFFRIGRCTRMPIFSPTTCIAWG